MTSRLYRSIRPLVAQVGLRHRASPRRRAGGNPDHPRLDRALRRGAILLDGRQTQTGVAPFLPGRAHDALNQLLRVMPLSTRALMGLLIAWVGRHHRRE